MKRVLLMALLLLLLSMLVPFDSVAAQASQPLELDRYERLIREARAAAARGDRLDLEVAARELLASPQVLMPDGTLAPADNRWLAAELARSDPDLALIAARLGALLDALAFVAPPASPEAQQRLQAILDRPPFANQTAPREPSAFERWLDELLRRLFEWLADQLGPIAAPVAEAASGPPGTMLAWLLTALAAILLLVVLGLWLRGARRRLQPTTTLPSPAERAARDTADARAQASALAATGDYRNAARMLALAALLWLDERGTLPYRPHQTNREHLGRLADRPVVRSHLAPVVETTDRVWYGGQPLDAEGYAAIERQVEALSHEETPR
ncbi:MAG: DUF4129 domain-containing protein [Oscillochloridaceae bacterium umkhey_bin13]